MQFSNHTIFTGLHGNNAVSTADVTQVGVFGVV
jgi:hypothetical protein